MITAKDFQAKFISIIDQQSNLDREAWNKADGSLVTNIDLKIESELYGLINENFADITIISEENTNSHKSQYLLSNKYAIVDPIDGTENFNYLSNLYGSVISIVYDNFSYHGIYIPQEKKIISSLNIVDQVKTMSSISLLSTSCLKSFDCEDSMISNHRILGSSSYMFALLLSGKANSFRYCKNCKIWDCFTGLSLVIMTGFYDVFLNGARITKIEDLVEMPHHSNFILKMK